MVETTLLPLEKCVHLQNGGISPFYSVFRLDEYQDNLILTSAAI